MIAAQIAAAIAGEQGGKDRTARARDDGRSLVPELELAEQEQESRRGAGVGLQLRAERSGERCRFS